MAKRRSKEELHELVERFHTSGMKRLEYSRQIGVGKSTLDRWIQRHGNQRHFIKVNIKQAKQPAAADRGFILVLANGRRIEAGWQYGDSDLTRLIRIAEAV